MRAGAARVLPVVLIVPSWSAAWYLAANVRTDCPSATLTAVLEGNAGCSAPIAYSLTHPTPWWGFNHAFGPLLLIALAAIPLITATYIEIQLHRRARAGG